MWKPKPIGGTGLTGLSTTDLERLLRALHRGELRCPIGHAELHMAGLSYLVDRVDALRGLDERGVRAVLVAVLAERRAREREERPPRDQSGGPSGEP
ncbi:MAG TPA: hypothetical protein VIL20_22460 [Sandaracinaceae bacterium]